MGSHRATVRVRYGRLAAAAAALTVTGVALMGSLGLAGDDSARAVLSGRGSAQSAGPERDLQEPAGQMPAEPKKKKKPRSSAPDSPRGDSSRTTSQKSPRQELPADSGTGRRAVFSQSEQHVWMVGTDGEVIRDYPVSGSVLDNLDPGTYEVFSRSRHAVGIEDSGTMGYFVRFTHGPSGAAIGFHDIPVKDGEPLQRADDLGTPQSHGCIRQQRRDAREMWRFAPVGTTVVVTA